MAGGIAYTGFVGTGEKAAIQSYRPCHLFGDSDLFGLGIRLGFYFIYVAAILSVLYGTDVELRVWRASFAIVALPVFISLCVASAAGTSSLVIINWAIVIQLVLWLPIFFVVPALRRHVVSVRRTAALVSDGEIRARVEARRGRPVTEVEAAQIRAYVNVLKAFAVQASLAPGDETLAGSRDELRQTLTVYVDAMTPARAADAPHGGYIAPLYHPQRNRELSAAPTTENIRSFQDNFVAASFREHGALSDAQQTADEAARIAAEEVHIARQTAPSRRILDHITTGAILDRVAGGLALLIYSAYMFYTPYLYWRAIDFGSKAGCTDVSVLFVLAPVSVYNSGFRTFLRVFAVLSVLVAIITTVLGFYLLFLAFDIPRRLRRAQQARAAGNAGPRGGRYATDDTVAAEEGYGPSESSWNSPLTPHAPADIEANILACFRPMFPAHSGAVTGSTTTNHAVVERERRHGLGLGLGRFALAAVLAILLIETIATVEATIPHNELDMSQPAMHSTAELLAFFIGVVALLLVLWGCVHQWRMRWMRGQRSRSGSGSGFAWPWRRRRGAGGRVDSPESGRNILAGETDAEKREASLAAEQHQQQQHPALRTAEPSRAVAPIPGAPSPVVGSQTHRMSSVRMGPGKFVEEKTPEDEQEDALAGGSRNKKG